MKKYKTEWVSVERSTLESCVCDLCGKEIKEGTFEVAETQVGMVTGKSYPECGNSRMIEYDICVDCFSGKLMPWLESQGATPTETESSW